jgi:hypothetical protein
LLPGCRAQARDLAGRLGACSAVFMDPACRVPPDG